MLIVGDNRETLKEVQTGSVDTCVTSPPYWGLRDYGNSQQIGLEKSPNEYVDQMVQVFGEVHRCLADHGSLFLNLGDSYATGSGAVGRCLGGGDQGERFLRAGMINTQPNRMKLEGFKPKDLVGIPWMVAFALREAGWYLRQDIIWHKPAPMPSSVKDRCTTSHEYIFLLTKSKRYYWDWFAISEESTQRPSGNKNRKSNPNPKSNFARNVPFDGERRNKRSVWTINTVSYKGAHFAVYPPELARTCILAGCPEKVCVHCGTPWKRQVDTERVPTRPGNDSKVGRPSQHQESNYHDHSGSVVGNRDPKRHATKYIDKGVFCACECEMEFRRGVVIDPFLGSGTTAQVAQELGRDWIGCELNPEYVTLIDQRTAQQIMF